MGNIKLENLGGENIGILSKYWNDFTNGFWDYLPKIVIALVILMVGFFVIKYIEKALTAFFNKTKFDEALERFIQSFIIILAKIFVVVVALLVLGAKLGAFAAAFGAMVFAIGMALQGSLSNFAGGILILFFKPFKLGDYITSGDHSGKVTDIQIFNTILKTHDGKKVILANGEVSNNTIVNHTIIKERRLDIVVGIDYSDDIAKAKEILKDIANSDERILENKEKTIVVKELGDNSVNLLFRVWTKNGDHWNTRFDTIEKIKLTFDKEGISFPFPQRDVHLYNEK